MSVYRNKFIIKRFDLCARVKMEVYYLHENLGGVIEKE